MVEFLEIFLKSLGQMLSSSFPSFFSYKTIDLETFVFLYCSTRVTALKKWTFKNNMLLTFLSAVNLVLLGELLDSVSVVQCVLISRHGHQQQQARRAAVRVGGLRELAEHSLVEMGNTGERY